MINTFLAADDDDHNDGDDDDDHNAGQCWSTLISEGGKRQTRHVGRSSLRKARLCRKTLLEL